MLGTLTAVTANRGGFHTVAFEPGFNVVLATMTEKSKRRDSRNGVGKSTFIEILHWCLGSNVAKGTGIRSDALEEWSFSLDLIVNSRQVRVSRSVANPSRLVSEGDLAGWPISPQEDEQTGERWFRVEDWRNTLGRFWFDLEGSNAPMSYSPTFRSLISYFLRRGSGGFQSPFKQHPNQQEWDIQVANAYLLGLNVELAAEWQRLKDEKKLVQDIGRAAQSGLLDQWTGSVDELTTQRVLLEKQAQEEREELQEFRILEQYRDIERRANDLTSTIHGQANRNLMLERSLDLYEASLEEEKQPNVDDVTRMYEEAGVTLGESVRRHLEDVVAFHHQVVRNRHDFLEGEIRRLREEIAAGREGVLRASEERAQLMRVLESHRALDEFTELQERHAQTVAKVQALASAIERLSEFQSRSAQLRIRGEELQLLARRDFSERQQVREGAVTLFNENSQALYQQPGHLVLGVRPKGYTFSVEIERRESHGVGNMLIFCYDLMLAELWAARAQSPRFLVHDSTVFDGVDERQRASALNLARRKAEEHGFQYVCCLNSDTVPSSELLEFDISEFVRATLTDESPEGSLLGMRF
jgi:uncharacterized protein YydD (DUF2326 family)